MDLRKHLEQYLVLIIAKSTINLIGQARELIEVLPKIGGKLYLAGNGASAALAAHACTDFTKQAKVPSITFHDPALITAFANDYGYDHWLEKALEFHLNPEDVVVLISVSGESASVVNAAHAAQRLGCKIISLTGRKVSNSLSQLADVSLHVKSDAYNVVENIHSIWLTSIVDLIVGRDVYEVS